MTYGFQRNINEELERNVKIEKKITRLIETAKGDENSKLIIEKTNNRQLICGTVQVLEINCFLKEISKLCNEEISCYEEFLKTENITWNDIKSNVFFDYKFGNGMSPLEMMYEWEVPEKKVFSFIVMDNEYPIIMNMSYRKITMPHSELCSFGIFATMKEFNVLGILTKTNDNFYLKPLALWNIVDIETAQGYVGHG